MSSEKHNKIPVPKVKLSIWKKWTCVGAASWSSEQNSELPLEKLNLFESKKKTKLQSDWIANRSFPPKVSFQPSNQSIYRWLNTNNYNIVPPYKETQNEKRNWISSIFFFSFWNYFVDPWSLLSYMCWNDAMRSIESVCVGFCRRKKRNKKKRYKTCELERFLNNTVCDFC